MSEEPPHCDVISLCDRRGRRTAMEHTSLENHALDRCEETFIMRAWDSFRYWHAIYVRERAKSREHATSDARRRG